MTLRTQRIGILLILAVLAYGGAYLVFRTLHLARTTEPGEFEVIVPQSQLGAYYFFRPLLYLDAAATGVHYHIGTHHPEISRPPR